MKRRDFLQGTALTLAAGAGIAPLELMARQGQQASSTIYPPALTGLRGSQPGSFEVAHELAWNGKTWPRPKAQTDDTYDLVIVGAGLSGLSAAYFYRERIGDDARILILDNHDDFGGHARRNEFTAGGRTLLCYGGSQSIDRPRAYSNSARRLLADLGIETDRFYDYFDFEFEKREGLEDGILFRQTQFGRDVLARNVFAWFTQIPRAEQIQRVQAFPVSEQTRTALIALLTGDMQDSPEARRMLLAPRNTPVEAFLRTAYGFTEEGLTLLRRRIAPIWGLGLDTLSISETIFEWYLGSAADRATYPLREDALEPRDEDQPYIFHFPDGNASIARLLVRSLVPGSIPGNTMEDVVTARADYNALDRSENLVRIRLNSTAVEARNRAGGVDLTYVNNGNAHRARARHCVFAGYNRMIPYLCPEIGDSQREALLYSQKVPLSVINVALDNWRAIKSSGISSYGAPSGLLTSIGMDFPVSMGGYGYTASPDQPCVLQGWHVPACGKQGTVFERLRAGRMEIYQMPFSHFEESIKDELNAAWGPNGLDVERDIKAITVNRWPHGYAYEYMDLWDNHTWSRGAGPHVIGRQQIGAISIANSDSEQYAYVNGAVDAAARAVRELTTD